MAAGAEQTSNGAAVLPAPAKPVQAPKAAAPQAATAAPGTAPPPPTAALKKHAIAAKELFGAVKTAAPLAARAIGTYARGCLAGAQSVPVDGAAWQVMRLSRNRNWGHPNLVKLVERFAGEVKKEDGWNGLLVGDISQPRGGPMLTGHASHQVGLDADIWFTPMPDRRLSAQERETIAATSMLAPGNLSVDPKVWNDTHVQIIKRAASYKEVERVLVHPAIKKALCEATAGADRPWLSKVRPIWGHYYHFHIRIACPKGSTGCKPQAPPPGDDGCGKELSNWMALLSKPPPPPSAKPAKPAPPKPPITLAQLPAECRMVLASGTPDSTVATSEENGKAVAGNKPAAKGAKTAASQK